MSSANGNQHEPSPAYRGRMRARFTDQAHQLYGYRHAQRRHLPLLAAAAALILALGLLWALQPAREAPATPEMARVVDSPEARVVAAAGARWEWTAPRAIRIDAGQLYLDVEPTGVPFEITGPQGAVSVLGTRLVVDAAREGLRVGLGSGKAELRGARGALALAPGEQALIARDGHPVREPARRFSFLAHFAQAALEEHAAEQARLAGYVHGSARVPDTGATSALEVVRYHLDVHVEDGMARTTIDQTFYNPSWNRVEATLRFPLPPDASISRLAMYVNGELMEGGMAERGRAAEVYEGIVRKMKDPALLEWMEGSTFRLRIFPFEPWNERRIVLSYQQPLDALYELERYRFPILQPSEPWGEFSIHVLVRDAAEGTLLRSTTYPLERIAVADGDVELSYRDENARPAKDLLLELRRSAPAAPELAAHHDGEGRWLCVTAQPEVNGTVHRGKRRALVLLDRSGGAAPAEREAQKRLARALLRALDRSDEIALLAYDAKVRAWREGFTLRTKDALADAIAFLEDPVFLGAGDLAAALHGAAGHFGAPRPGDVIFYLGDGIDTLSGLEAERLAELVPTEIPFLALPVGRSYDRRLLGALAARSGGRIVPLSPDERLGWRAFDLVSSLRTPQLEPLEWKLLDAAGQPVQGSFRVDRASLRDGERLRIAGKLDGEWPTHLRLNGQLLALPERRAGCGWIPRLWARLQIDALERDSAEEHRAEIVALGKQHYVMTPFTSLLVLENEAMYAQHKIDRGREDHWARYAAPKKWTGKVRTPPQQISYWGRQPIQITPQWNSWKYNPQLQVHTVLPQYENTILHIGAAPVVETWRATTFLGGSADSTMGLPMTVLNPTVPNFRVFSSGSWFSKQNTSVQIDPAHRIPLTGYRPAFSYDTELLLSDSPHKGWLNVAFPVFPQNASQLQKFLAFQSELSAEFGERRAVFFGGGERLLIDAGRVLFRRGIDSITIDPLFATALVDDPHAWREWAQLPWFLTPAELLLGGAQVTRRDHGSRTVYTIDRGSLTSIEICFEGRKPVETRVRLRGGTVLQRAVYDAWTARAGRLLPAHAVFHGLADTVLGEASYRYTEPAAADRNRLAQINAILATREQQNTPRWDLHTALAYYRGGRRAELEQHLKMLAENGRASADLRTLARLATLRWNTAPCIEAPVLDARAPQVRRWLPPEPAPIAAALAAAFRSGDVAALRALTFAAEEPRAALAELERLRQRAPEGLRGLLDVWSGELAQAQGWTLKAYAALERALEDGPFAASVALRDRLSELATSLHKPEAAFAHAERALTLVARVPGAPLRARYLALEQIASQRPELWKGRGRAILERWAASSPRDPEPFQRLAERLGEAGQVEEAFRYASQPAEVAVTPAAFDELARRAGILGLSERAQACRTIAARLRKR